MKQQSKGLGLIIGFYFDLSLRKLFHLDLVKLISFGVGGSYSDMIYAVATEVSFVREGGPRD